MQPNTIAISVDPDRNSGTAAVAVTFTRHREELNSSTYRTTTHTDAAPDTLKFLATPSKRVGEFLGVQRVTLKRTQTVTVQNASGIDVTAPMIGEISFAIPAGVTDVAKLAFKQQLLALLDSSEGAAAVANLLYVSEI